MSKPLAMYYKRGSRMSGVGSWCKSCIAETSASRRRSDQLHAAKQRTRGLLYRRRLRRKVLDAYGGKCSCCGEANEEFLALDHVNGGGSKERREKASNQSTRMYLLVVREGFPDRYRLLCHNCNCSLGWYGYCPHQRGKR